MLSRSRFIDRLASTLWDVVIVGGGATGMGAALDSASRGYKTLLLERGDFGIATSSRSTKLIHGGVRYLAQGNISLVRESLYERGLLLRNAPGLVTPLEFVVPTESIVETAYYATGLKLYDALAGRLRIRWSRALTRDSVSRRIPTINVGRISGGVSYFDAQFDDARLLIACAQTCSRLGGSLLNYFEVTNLLKSQGRVCGVAARDVETGLNYDIRSRAVINATGIFTDELRSIDEPAAPPMLQLSRGSHIALSREFLPGETAIIVPRTEDGRVLFLIPWQGATLVGTTDLSAPRAEVEPHPSPEEIEYLLEYAGRYLNVQPRRSDIRSCFAGLRPLAREEGERSTSRLSRDHVLKVSPSGLVTITGGKWTTFRRMGHDAVTAAARAGQLESKSSATHDLQLGEATPPEPLDPSNLDRQVRRFVREEMARKLDDILSRRSRLLLTDARTARQLAPAAASILAEELAWTDDQRQAELSRFQDLSAAYLP